MVDKRRVKCIKDTILRNRISLIIKLLESSSGYKLYICVKSIHRYDLVWRQIYYLSEI